jgi:transposase
MQGRLRGGGCPSPRSGVDTLRFRIAGQPRRRVAPEGLSGVRLRMVRSTEEEIALSEQRKYRSWTAQQKLEIVLAGLRGDRPVREVCREHGIAETLFYTWRERLFEGGLTMLAGKEERRGERDLRRKNAQLERALGRKTYELEIAGKLLRE